MTRIFKKSSKTRLTFDTLSIGSFYHTLPFAPRDQMENSTPSLSPKNSAVRVLRGGIETIPHTKNSSVRASR
jgi:hypothetical protein